MLEFTLLTGCVVNTTICSIAQPLVAIGDCRARFRRVRTELGGIAFKLVVTFYVNNLFIFIPLAGGV